jgi:type II secretory pathway pseudopilin PulG
MQVFVKSRARSARKAFTLVDMLVVMTIIGILVALLLPAVQKIRAAAAFTQSTNNLRQMNLGLQALARANGGLLPPSYGPFPNAGGPNGTLFYFLLPYIEEDNIYDHYTAVSGSSSTKGGGSTTTIGWSQTTNSANIPIQRQTEALGSSSQTGVATSVGGNLTYIPVAVKTYVAPGDTTNDPTIPGLTSYASNYLVFGTRGARLPGTFRDGTSKTVVLMERYAQTGYEQLGGKVDYEEGSTAKHFWSGETSWNNWLSSTPTSGFQLNPAPVNANNLLPQGFSSDGMQVGLGDGSVRTITSSVSALTWYLACNPADGQIMPPDW